MKNDFKNFLQEKEETKIIPKILNKMTKKNIEIDNNI